MNVCRRSDIGLPRSKRHQVLYEFSCEFIGVSAMLFFTVLLSAGRSFPWSGEWDYVPAVGLTGLSLSDGGSNSMSMTEKMVNDSVAVGFRILEFHGVWAARRKDALAAAQMSEAQREKAGDSRNSAQ